MPKIATTVTRSEKREIAEAFRADGFRNEAAWLYACAHSGLQSFRYRKQIGTLPIGPDVDNSKEIRSRPVMRKPGK